MRFDIRYLYGVEHGGRKALFGWGGGGMPPPREAKEQTKSRSPQHKSQSLGSTRPLCIVNRVIFETTRAVALSTLEFSNEITSAPVVDAYSSFLTPGVTTELR